MAQIQNEANKKLIPTILGKQKHSLDTSEKFKKNYYT